MIHYHESMKRTRSTGFYAYLNTRQTVGSSANVHVSGEQLNLFTEEAELAYSGLAAALMRLHWAMACFVCPVHDGRGGERCAVF